MTLQSDSYSFVHGITPTCICWLDGDGARLIEAHLRTGEGERDAVLFALHEGARTVSNPQLQEALSSAFWNHFAGLLRRIAGVHEHSIEALESALGVVWLDRQRLDFRNERQFLAYLRRRMRWRAQSQRRSSSAASLDNLALMDPGPGPATHVRQEMERSDLRTRIDALPDRERTLILGRLAGKPLDQQMKELQLSESTYRRLLRKSLDRLRPGTE